MDTVRAGVVIWMLAGALALVSAPAFAHPEPNDVDGDGVMNAVDNCPDARNATQADVDRDGRGDVCDPDADNDTIANAADNCPLAPNVDQSDDGPEGTPGNGVGDVCDADDDGDGRNNAVDNCPLNGNADQLDNDRDGQGDVCDPDDDDDGLFDSGTDYDRDGVVDKPPDNCQFVYNYEQVDNDADGRGALCDADDGPPRTSAGPQTGGGPAVTVDRVAPRVTVTLPRSLRFAQIEAGVFVKVRCSEACAVTADLRVGSRIAKRLGLRRGAALATGSAQLGGAAGTYAFARFQAKTWRKLVRMKSVRATVRVTIVDRAGNRSSATRTLTLRR